MFCELLLNAKLLLNVSCRGGEIENFFSCEPFEFPLVSSNNGQLRFGKKADIVNILLDHQPSSKLSCPSDIDGMIFYAATFVRSLYRPDHLHSFNDYKKHFFEHIRLVITNISRVDLCFDLYLISSLKSTP